MCVCGLSYIRIPSSPAKRRGYLINLSGSYMNCEVSAKKKKKESLSSTCARSAKFYQTGSASLAELTVAHTL